MCQLFLTKLTDLGIIKIIITFGLNNSRIGARHSVTIPAYR